MLFLKKLQQMKKVIQLICGISILLFSCSEPLDASKVEKEKLNLLEFDTPIEVNVLKGSKASVAAEPEDMLGMYSIFSTKVIGGEEKEFSVEVTCTTMPGMTMEEVLAEKTGELKAETGFSKVVQEDADGFLFERNEINDEMNYSFIKVFVTDELYVVVSPEPKAEGNTTLDEAKFMYEILNAQ